MLNIVVPMAGRGSRFRDAGYDRPKPMILVHGEPMIEVVVRNITPARKHRFIFLCLAEHLQAFELEPFLKQIAPGCEVVPVQGVTEGAACTVLLAKALIDNDQPMMMANSDQFVDMDINKYLAAADPDGIDGLIMTMKADDPKWSFIGFDEQGNINRVVEKEVISDEATVGIYNYARGADFVAAANEMIRKDIRVNGEFYVAPVYNEMIAQGKQLAYYNIGGGMHGLGTPADLDLFLANPVSKNK